MPSEDINRNYAYFTYVRYADDWIVLNNASKRVNVQLKKEIAQWLKDNLDATLSEQKTLITDMREQSAHYLGFELRVRDTRKLAKKPSKKAKREVLSKVAGHKIKIYPDRARLINRCYMKGYCHENGYPREIPWLTGLEPFMIIDKYNAVIRGFAQFYAEFVENKASLGRWIYIYRFSCIKTLAQKFSCTTREIFRRFATENEKYRRDFGKTIEIKVQIKYLNDTTYEKTYRLITYREALKLALELEQEKKYAKTHESLSNLGDLEAYKKTLLARKTITPLSPDYLDRIKWVNWRTMCSLDMPCCICGQYGNEGMSSEMHHINHVRKRKWIDIREEQTWAQMMSLRNRKQIPTCERCHRELIHEGKYKGTALKLLVPKVLVDNRIISVENYVQPSKLDADYRKTMKQRGWELVNPS